MSNVRKEKGQYLVAEIIDSSLELEGSATSAIGHLEDLCKDHLNVVIEQEYHDGYYSGERGHFRLVLKGDRLATDAEIAKYETKLAKDRERAKIEKKVEREENKKRKEKEDKKALERAEKAFPERFK